MSQGRAIIITQRAWTRVLVGAAVVGLALAPSVRAQDASVSAPEKTSERTIDIELKGQLYSETTDFGTGLDRQGSRTDIHFQRLRLTVTGMLDSRWGFKFQTCGNCGTSK